MFIGHFGLGLAAKKIDSKPSLGTMFLASQFIDLLWPTFLLLGIETVKVEPGNTAFTPLNFSFYPFSHGLFSVIIWAILFGGVYYFFKKSIKSSIILGALVLSHWILDLFTHIPDLPILPWSEFKVGFGLWNSVLFTVIVEGFIFAAGSYLYLTSTKAENKKGSIGLWSLLGFLIIIYISNLAGSPPPDQLAIAIVGQSQWLLIIWAYWIDRNRGSVN
ncbi:MAG: metal-dependent hydrolase [Bacteroidetes bacterium]|nr:metal-dependent hydrolase [Bacteroidota bacterium]